MASFKGLLNDAVLKFISIDNFERHTNSCTTFLLSHIHTDHTHGLFYPYDDGKWPYNFSDVINDSDKYIYCSSITRCLILKHRYNKVLASRIKSLDAGQYIDLYSPDKRTHVLVTAFPASHCMGSVIFLLEYNFKKILFACDFRLQINGFETFPRLKDLKIDDLYIDATFADEQHMHFPTRDESISRIISVIKHWKTTDYNIKVLLKLPYKFGMEFMFKRLHKEFGCPVHVEDGLYDSYYVFIEDTYNSYITADLGSTFIHACFGTKTCKSCPKIKSNNYKTLKPCAWSFTSDNKIANFVSENEFKVCYSSHCSLTELSQLVQLIKPKQIIPLYDKSPRSSAEIISCIQRVDTQELVKKTQDLHELKRSNVNHQDSAIYERKLEQKKQKEQEFTESLYT